MARVARRQIKEDKLISTTAKLSVFLSKNWKTIAFVVAGVIVVGAASAAYHRYATGRNEGAARNLSQARALLAQAESAPGTDGKTETTVEKFEEAKAKFDQVSRKGGHSYTISESLFYSARCSYQLEKYGEAIAAFQETRDRYPKSIFAVYARRGVAQCYEQLGDDESLRKAIRQYEDLSKLSEAYISWEAFYDKGRCYEKLGEWEQATAAYGNIVDEFKQNVEAAVQEASKAQIRKAKDAISKYQAAAGEGPSESDFARFLNEAKLREKSGQGQSFEALKSYDKAILSQKEWWSQQEGSGEASWKLQEASDSLKSYEDTSDRLIRYIIKAQQYEKRGDWDNAVRYYRAAVEFDFMPGLGLFEKAQFRADWIDSIGRLQIPVSSQHEQAES